MKFPKILLVALIALFLSVVGAEAQNAPTYFIYTPIANQTIITPNGNSYTSDTNHLIYNPQASDVNFLVAVGCVTLNQRNNVVNGSPAPGNDFTQLYGIGSYWFDTANNTQYIMTSAGSTPGNAVWAAATSSGLPGAVANDITSFTAGGGLQDLGTATNNAKLSTLAPGTNQGLITENVAFVPADIVSGGVSIYTGLVITGTVKADNGSASNDISGGYGIYVSMADAPGVTSATKGKLSGLQCSLQANISRTTPTGNSPYDDVTCLGVNNVGTGAGTDGIFLGHSANPSPYDWITAINLSANAFYGLYINGEYYYGIDLGFATFYNSNNEAIRLPNGGFITQKNGATDYNLIGSDGTNDLVLGQSSGVNTKVAGQLLTPNITASCSGQANGTFEVLSGLVVVCPNTVAPNNDTLVSNGSGVISFSATLPVAVQNNITNLGTVTTGAINGITGITNTPISGSTGAFTTLSAGTIAGSLGEFNQTIMGTVTTGAVFVGDGTTDNTAALAALFARTDSPTIELAEGIYVFTSCPGSTLVAALSVGIKGAGENNTILRFPSSCTLPTVLWDWDGKPGVHLSDFTLDLNTPTANGSTANRIAIYAYSADAWSPTIRRVRVVNDVSPSLSIVFGAANGHTMWAPVVEDSNVTFSTAATSQNQCIAFTTNSGAARITGWQSRSNTCSGSGIQYDGDHGYAAGNDVSGWKFGTGYFYAENVQVPFSVSSATWTGGVLTLTVATSTLPVTPFIGQEWLVAGATNSGTGGNSAVNGPFQVASLGTSGSNTLVGLALSAQSGVIGTVAGTITAGILQDYANVDEGNVAHDSTAGLDVNNTAFGGWENGASYSTFANDVAHDTGAEGFLNFGDGNIYSGDKSWNNGKQGATGDGGAAQQTAITVGTAGTPMTGETSQNVKITGFHVPSGSSTLYGLGIFDSGVGIPTLDASDTFVGTVSAVNNQAGVTLSQFPLYTPSVPGVFSTGVTVICTGSSHCAYGDANSYGTYSGGVITPSSPCPAVNPCASYLDGSLLTWVSLYTNNRVTRIPNTNNFGVYSAPLEALSPGSSVPSIAAYWNALVSTVTSAGGTPVIIEAGGADNSVIAGDTCAQVIALDEARNQVLMSLGAVVVEATIYPRAASPTPFTANQIKVASCFNAHLRSLVGQQWWGRYYLVDMDGVVSDPSQTTAWVPRTGYVEPSGVHLSAQGASAAGFAVAQQVVDLLYPAWPAPWANYLDVWDATYNPRGNKSTNPGMTGTGGTFSGAGCIGVLPDGFTLTCSNGATATASVVTNGDGSPGIQLVLGGTASAQGTGVELTEEAAGGSFATNEQIQASAWINWTGIANVYSLDVNLQSNGVGVNNHGGQSAFQTNMPSQPASGSGAVVQEQTPIRVVTGGDTAEYETFYVNVNTGAVTGTVMIRSLNLKQATP